MEKFSTRPVNSTCVEDLVEFADFECVDSESACLLGAPSTNGPAMDKALIGRCNDLARGIRRLKLLASHDALVILKASLSTPKLLHIMRSSPCADHEGLERFDSLLRTGLSSIQKIVISDVNWIQASLPVSDGAWGSVALLCWHLPPFWLPPRVRRICKSISSYTVTPLLIRLLYPHSLFGSPGTWLRRLIRRAPVGSAAETEPPLNTHNKF